MKKLSDKTKLISLLAILGIITFIFFAKIHPIIVLDTDDWWYVSLNRYAIPLWGSWNPTRVFPETITPIVSAIAVHVIMPFNKNYIGSIAIMNALTVTIFMIGYLYCFIKLLRTKFKTNTFNTTCITIIFYLLHFLIFRCEETNNLYMFYAVDSTCYYFYVIPSLLNCSLIMYFIADDTFNKKNSIYKISILIVLLYCAIFSNLFQSIILAVYIASQLIYPTLELFYNKNKDRFKKYINKQYPKYLILFVWLIEQLLEMNGGRSKILSNDLPFINKLSDTINYLFKFIKQFNKLFILILLGSIVVSVFLYFKDKLYNKKIVHIISFNMFFTILYLILLCAASIPSYISRADASYGIMYYVLIFIIFTITYFISKYPKTALLLPLSIYIMFFNINTSSRTFRESNTLNMAPEDCYLINDIIINQIKEHVDKGETEMTLYLPKFDSSDNWPYATYGLDRIKNSLYKHGIIKNDITINYVFSNELYQDINFFRQNGLQ